MKNKIKVLILLLVITSTTGCTKMLKDNENKSVVNPSTNQALVENILCKPTDEETVKIYEEKASNVDINSLPSCSDFNVTTGGYEGIWTTIFVKPLAWFIIKLGELVKSYGFALIIATIIIRLIMYPFTKKQLMQSENMKKAQPELNKLEKKYANKNDQQSMMAKSQEMMMIYKKYQINPLTGCLFSFLQIPLFFAFLEAINRIPVLFEGTFLTLQLGTSPAVALLTHGEFKYIILILLVILTTYYSFKLNSGASMSKEQEEQMKMMKNIMMITMIIASFTISTGIAIYWITSSAFTIFQNLLVKRSKRK